MHRLFDTHRSRRHFYLDGMWRFAIDPTGAGRRGQWYLDFPGNSDSHFVPSCWNNEMGLYHYEGVAWYQTTFRSDARNLRLVFHAVNTEADVYLDGRHLGYHYGGFLKFGFTVTGVTPGEHTLTVRVDNTHNQTDTIPLARVDWFHYGGIIRSVEVMELPTLWIERCRIAYDLTSDDRASLSIRALLRNLGSQASEAALALAIDNRQVWQGNVPAPPGESEVAADGIELGRVERWNLENPRLYTARLALVGPPRGAGAGRGDGRAEDDLVERIGFRTVRAEAGRILVNGKPVFLKGVNRHEEHPDWGFAFPAKLMKRDLDIVRRLGCNSIRCSHYPNSELFLDLCDERGILVWEEIPMWGFPEQALANERVRERGLAMLRGMVERDRHHPAVILWGLHNEVDTTCDAGYEVTEAFGRAVRELDPTRLVTYASNHDLEDRCFGLVDVAGVNRYFGWYHDDYRDWTAHLEALKSRLSREGLGAKPLIISEFGAAGIAGDTGFESRKWSEQYQQELIAYLVKLFGGDTDVAGFYMWQFCDIRTSREMEANRARSFNNKGLLNEYRKPKLAYWAAEHVIRGLDR